MLVAHKALSQPRRTSAYCNQLIKWQEYIKQEKVMLTKQQETCFMITGQILFENMLTHHKISHKMSKKNHLTRKNDSSLATLLV